MISEQHEKIFCEQLEQCKNAIRNIRESFGSFEGITNRLQAAEIDLIMVMGAIKNIRYKAEEERRAEAEKRKKKADKRIKNVAKPFKGKLENEDKNESEKL